MVLYYLVLEREQTSSQVYSKSSAEDARLGILIPVQVRRTPVLKTRFHSVRSSRTALNEHARVTVTEQGPHLR